MVKKLVSTEISIVMEGGDIELHIQNNVFLMFGLITFGTFNELCLVGSLIECSNISTNNCIELCASQLRMYINLLLLFYPFRSIIEMACVIGLFF